jgi:hypothetical protein
MDPIVRNGRGMAPMLCTLPKVLDIQLGGANQKPPSRGEGDVMGRCRIAGGGGLVYRDRDGICGIENMELIEVLIGSLVHGIQDEGIDNKSSCFFVSVALFFIFHFSFFISFFFSPFIYSLLFSWFPSLYCFQALIDAFMPWFDLFLFVVPVTS